MGAVPEKRCRGGEAARVVPRGVYKILQTGESPIDGLDVKVSEINYGEDKRGKGHTITYAKKKQRLV